MSGVQSVRDKRTSWNVCDSHCEAHCTCTAGQVLEPMAMITFDNELHELDDGCLLLFFQNAVAVGVEQLAQVLNLGAQFDTTVRVGHQHAMG